MRSANRAFLRSVNRVFLRSVNRAFLRSVNRAFLAFADHCLRIKKEALYYFTTDSSLTLV